MHANFSNEVLRICSSQEVYEKKYEAFRPATSEHIAVYGTYKNLSLTGKHENALIHNFSYSVLNRGCFMRIPLMTVQKDG